MTEQKIVNRADLRKWRIELPNLYDESGLDPYEFRLLVHYVRRGNCYESVRTTAECCNMSSAQVVKKRNSLEEKKFIRVSENERGTLTIEVVDMWELNFVTYSGVSDMNTRSPHEQECSQDELGCSPRERGCSPREHKKEPIKKQPDKKKPNKKNTGATQSDSRVKDMVSAFQELIGYPIANWGAESKAAKNIMANGYGWEDVKDCYGYMKAEEFWKDKHIGLASVHKRLGAWIEAGRPYHKNGERELTLDERKKEYLGGEYGHLVKH